MADDIKEKSPGDIENIREMGLGRLVQEAILIQDTLSGNMRLCADKFPLHERPKELYQYIKKCQEKLDKIYKELDRRDEALRTYRFY